jgi:hypothetical protein
VVGVYKPTRNSIHFPFYNSLHIYDSLQVVILNGVKDPYALDVVRYLSSFLAARLPDKKV